MARRGKRLDQSFRKILIQLKLHAVAGAAGTGISSSAEVAANAITARMGSGDTDGKAGRISFTGGPSPRLGSNGSTGTPRPLPTRSPPQPIPFRSEKSREF